MVKTADSVFVTLSPVAVAAKARNPNAAKLLMDFVLSREAQLILRNANRSSGRLDVEPLVPEMHPSKLKLAAIDPSVGENLTPIQAKSSAKSISSKHLSAILRQLVVPELTEI